MKKQIFFSIVFSFIVSIAFTQENRFSPEFLWKLGRVSLDDVSPDGHMVLYGITYYNVDQNKGNRDLYIVAEKGGKAKKITAFPGSEYNAKFRPDGKRIGFLHNQVMWEMNLDGSDKTQVSDQKMNGFLYAPTQDYVLFIEEVDYSQTNHLMADLPKANALITDDLMYRHWDSWEDHKRSNIFYAPYIDGTIPGEATNIQNEAYDVPLQPFGGMDQIAWSPDGKQIAYTCKKLSGKDYATSTNSDIFLYDLDARTTTNLTSSMPGYDMNPVWSSNGQILAWNSMEEPGYEADRDRIFLLDIKNNKRSELTHKLNESVGSIHWSKDDKVIYTTIGDKGTYQVAKINVSDGDLEMITAGRHNYYSLLVSQNGLIGRRASMSDPHELYFINIDSGNEQQISFVNTELLSKVNGAKIESKWIKTYDNEDMLVWYIYPPDFDPSKKYPTLLYCQGGPQSAVSQFFSYRWNFQLMAANNYIIIAPNRRGLPTFGQEWNEQISGDWGGKAMRDYLTAIDDAVDYDYVDSERLGAIGASYGGYSVYWLAGNHQKRFKSFISHCGTFNLESWYGITEEVFFANKDLGGAYWNADMKETYEKFSPHNYVQNWDTPILVIHGGKDFRIPMTEGMQAFSAAKLQDIKSRFLYFPEENHWVLKPQNGILWHRVFFDWLEETLK
jgi:dipeptidyl aminopeptidase/acylaminoacyl peptidase